MHDIHVPAPAGSFAPLARLARAHAPILRLDAAEPFRPDCAGVTRLAPGERSPSCRHVPPAPEGSATVLEYAVWWDGDIGHLYELEHVWVCLDAQERPLAVLASAHGGLVSMEGAEWQDGRPVLYCEPGKHAHAAGPAAIRARRAALDAECRANADRCGVLIPDMFRAELGFVTAYDRFLAREWLAARAFSPAYDFAVTVDLAELTLMDWPGLAAHVPVFLRSQLETLRRQWHGLKAVFLDSGDTLIDEMTQIFAADARELVLSAEPIPGAVDMVRALAARGVPLALVADGREASFVNVLGAAGLWDLFEARAISECAGVAKPHPRMFAEGLRGLGLRAGDAAGVMMVGNNLHRDIRGARGAGLMPVWLDWNDRYDRRPAHADDRPDHVITKPAELLDIVETLLARSGFDAG